MHSRRWVIHCIRRVQDETNRLCDDGRPVCRWCTPAPPSISTRPTCRRRAPSRAAVVSEGGRTVYLAGQTTLTDDNGGNIAGNFDAQARTIFRLLDKTLQRAGGSLKNMATMTVFITDVRNGDRFVEIRKEMFPDGNFPASALITVSGLALPRHADRDSGIGVIGDTCSNEKPCTKK